MEVPQGKDMPCLRTAFSHLLSFSNKPFAKEGRANIFDVDPLRLVIIDSNNFEIKNNNNYTKQSFHCPWSQPDSVEFKNDSFLSKKSLEKYILDEHS